MKSSRRVFCDAGARARREHCSALRQRCLPHRQTKGILVLVFPVCSRSYPHVLCPTEATELVSCGQVHLRLYVAITSLEPLRVLLFRDGLVLFANAEYDLSEDSLQSKHVHLTNAAIGHPANKKEKKLVSPSQDQLEAEYDNSGDEARSWLTCVLNRVN